MAQVNLYCDDSKTLNCRVSSFLSIKFPISYLQNVFLYVFGIVYNKLIISALIYVKKIALAFAGVGFCRLFFDELRTNTNLLLYSLDLSKTFDFIIK